MLELLAPGSVLPTMYTNGTQMDWDILSTE
jgi:hypothetical protein